ncbi:UNVERIFIED_CONTAM: hypothetical protein RMT77_003801 [Armadillidium vulgare]
MIISDVRREFYDLLIGKRVLLLVHFDIDGICASKILQSLFRSDHILYTLVPVQTRHDLKKAFEDHAEQIKVIIFVNCGGCIDIIDFLQPDKDVMLYIADNHRPLDVCNIYNVSQVKIVSKFQDDEEIPSFEEIFRDDESEHEEMDGENPPKFDEEYLENRRDRRKWEQRRQKLLFDYSQFSFYSSSTSVLFYELSWKISKDSNELLWWAIVGQTYLYITEKIEQDNNLLVTASLQNHVSRLNHKTQDEKPLDSIKITFDKELNLVLYRHWTLVESMKHSSHFASSLKLWTLKGEMKMHELLAEMGIPLTECGQNYSNMDISLRGEIQELLENKSEKYGISNMTYASFSLNHGFRSKFCASDSVYSSSALLESPDKSKLNTDCFLDASDSLNLSKISVLEHGIECSKTQYEAIYRQVTTFLNMNQVISAGPFLYATVLQGSPDAGFFSSPNCLTMLAQFTLKAHIAVSRSKKSRSLPLVISAPDVRNPLMDVGSSQVELETCLICGIPPVIEGNKNFFGKAFEQAATKTNSKADLDFFDTNIIRLCVSDRSKFFDALISILC